MTDEKTNENIMSIWDEQEDIHKIATKWIGTTFQYTEKETKEK